MKYVGAGCYDVYNSAQGFLGETVPVSNQAVPIPGDTCATKPNPPAAGLNYVSGQMQVELAGRGCTANSDLDGTLPNSKALLPGSKKTGHGWVHFQFTEDAGAQLQFQGLEGFMPFDDIDNSFQTNTPPTQYLNDLNHAYPGCGGTINANYKTQLNDMKNIPLSRQQTTLTDNFTSANEYFENSSGVPFPMSRNQELPNVDINEGMFFNSTTATFNGDVVRGIVPKGTLFKELDYIPYPDPNDLCGPFGNTPGADTLVDWVFGELANPVPGRHEMIGWIPYRDPGASSC